MVSVVITDSDFGRGEIESEELGPDFVVSFLGTREKEPLLSGIADADVLMVQWAQIDGELMDAAAGLKGIVRFGMGLDNIDLPAAKDRGIVVWNVDDFCIDEVADHAVSMIEATNRRLWQLDRAVKRGEWGPALVPAPLQPKDAPVGVAGLGRIGRLAAGRLSAQGYPVLYWDLAPDVQAPSGAHRVDTLRELAQECVYLTVHVPLNETTAGLVDASVLQALGPGGYLVNVGRGGLVDETALCEALDSGTIAGACLDVLLQEPPTSGASALLAAHPRVLMTPHVAYLSTQALTTLRRNAAARVRWIVG